MKTKIIIGTLVLSLFGFAVVMNPHKEMHVQKINDLIEKPLKNSSWLKLFGNPPGDVISILSSNISNLGGISFV